MLQIRDVKSVPWGGETMEAIQYRLDFGRARRAADELDKKFALLADQDYNYGNHADWFACFRGGLYGFYARLFGVAFHFEDVHTWHPAVRTYFVTRVEYHASSFFFHAESAIECHVFALNALGYCAEPQAFVDISKDDNLRKVSPYNVVGSEPIEGYEKYFPCLRAYWERNANLLQRIRDHTNVSKHRERKFGSGEARNDPPPGFFEQLKLDPASPEATLVRPYKTILLEPEPTLRLSRPRNIPREEIPTLEQLGRDYESFINQTTELALSDARANIPLKVPEFRR